MARVRPSSSVGIILARGARDFGGSSALEEAAVSLLFKTSQFGGEGDAGLLPGFFLLEGCLEQGDKACDCGFSIRQLAAGLLRGDPKHAFFAHAAPEAPADELFLRLG